MEAGKLISRGDNSSPRRSEKVGKKFLKLGLKGPESRDPIEISRQLIKNNEKNIIESVKRGKKKYCGNFYVEVIIKTEKVLSQAFNFPNAFHQRFLERKSCPRPTYDQTVYLYDRRSDDVKELWVLPDKKNCEIYKANVPNIVPEEYDILSYILNFYDGSLNLKSDKLNGII